MNSFSTIRTRRSWPAFDAHTRRRRTCEFINQKSKQCARPLAAAASSEKYRHARENTFHNSRNRKSYEQLVVLRKLFVSSRGCRRIENRFGWTRLFFFCVFIHSVLFRRRESLPFGTTTPSLIRLRRVRIRRVIADFIFPVIVPSDARTAIIGFSHNRSVLSQGKLGKKIYYEQKKIE